MRQVLIRCDGGPDIGLGHVMRCRGLAAAFESRGWHARFAMCQASAAHFPELAPVVVPAGVDGARAIRDLASSGDCLVVDHYGLDAAFERAARGPGVLVLAIDDLADRPHDCEVLVDGNPARREADYSHLAPGARLLLGTAFAILKPDFARRRVIGDVPAVARHLVMMPGGADPSNVSSRLLDVLPALGGLFEILLVVGRVNPRREALVRKAAEVGADVAVDPIDLVAIMAGADIAVCGAGTTCLELACLGIPAVALVLADNQRSIAAALNRAGAARVLGERAVPDRLASELRDLAVDAGARQTMRAAAQALIDGHGAQRVADSVLQIAIRK